MKRALVFLLSCALLAGCGGGGGGGNSNPPGPTPPPPPPVGTQAAFAAQALSVLKVGQTLSSGVAGPNGQNLQSIARRVAQGLGVSHPLARTTGTHPLAVPTPPPGVMSACSNKSEFGSQSGQDATGPYKDLWLYTFYDANCTQSYSQTYYRERVINPTSQTETLDLIGSVTYLQGGSAVSFSNSEVQIIVATGGLLVPQAFQQNIETGASQSQPPIAETGAACSYNGGTPSSCGFANVNNVTSLNADLGMTINLSSYSQASTPDGGVTYTISGTIEGFNGSFGGLSFGIGTFPNWTMSGGTAGPTTTLTATYDYDPAGLADGGSINATDKSDGIIVSVSIDGNGNMTGTLKSNGGAAIATFNADVVGNGTLKFSDGNTAFISSFGLL